MIRLNSDDLVLYGKNIFTVYLIRWNWIWSKKLGTDYWLNIEK